VCQTSVESPSRLSPLHGSSGSSFLFWLIAFPQIGSPTFSNNVDQSSLGSPAPRSFLNNYGAFSPLNRGFLFFFRFSRVLINRLNFCTLRKFIPGSPSTDVFASPNILSFRQNLWNGPFWIACGGLASVFPFNKAR